MSLSLVDPAVTRVIQPLRRLPLALRDDVMAELHKLLGAGIIERVGGRFSVDLQPGRGKEEENRGPAALHRPQAGKQGSDPR